MTRVEMINNVMKLFGTSNKYIDSFIRMCEDERLTYECIKTAYEYTIGKYYEMLDDEEDL